MKSGIPIIGFTGHVEKFLRRNDGNGAANAIAVLVKNQYFYCCDSFLLTNIGMLDKPAKKVRCF
ncbi:hypothetical protein AAGF08_16325 [Algoriphagus sp. SE2]|uniref:hypothetical protein n=1 Tax=Algoriphagus sp. SE2 TaxID=3141536 RepID=UPI0031CD7E83